MHSSSKRVAKPRKYFSKTAHYKGTSVYDQCPECGEDKTVVSSLCRKCTIGLRRTKVSEDVFYIEGEPCRYIPLTRGKSAIVDANLYPELSRFNWFAQKVHKREEYYAARWVKQGEMVGMHRWIVGKGQKYVDHRNRNTLDNRRSNLRKCNPRQNIANRKKMSNNTSGYIGVSENRRTAMFLAAITHKGKLYRLGYFYEAEEAAKCYDAVAVYVNGEFAQTNFPQK